MKLYSLTLVALVAFLLPGVPPAIPAGTFNLDTSHSTIEFKVRHLGLSTVTGSFDEFEGTITIPANGLAGLQTSVTIQTASIDTGNDRRDGHLQGTDFFDAATNPTITFTSTGVRNVNGNNFELLGNLNMHGVTKPIVLEAEYQGEAQDGRGNTRVGFRAEGRINRTEWGLTWNQALEAGGVLVSEEVRLELDVQAIKQP